MPLAGVAIDDDAKEDETFVDEVDMALAFRL